MNTYIKTLIEQHNNAVSNIKKLETSISDFVVFDEKSKVNYGNLCVALNGFRNVANATECMLINEDVVKLDNGEFYQKVVEEEIPTTEDKGSDFDVDKKTK